MTVQVATCSAAQLFSECLHPESSSSANAIVTSDNETVKGALTIPEDQRPYGCIIILIKRSVVSLAYLLVAPLREK